MCARRIQKAMEGCAARVISEDGREGNRHLEVIQRTARTLPVFEMCFMLFKNVWDDPVCLTLLHNYKNALTGQIPTVAGSQVIFPFFFLYVIRILILSKYSYDKM